MSAIVEMREGHQGLSRRAGDQAISTSTLSKGEIHALLGENGAGKSTLTKIMAGVVEPSAGRDVPQRAARSRYAIAARGPADGIAMVFQETSLVPSMTVAQNLYLGTEKFLNRLRGIYIAAQQFLQSLNFTVDPTATVATLGAAKRQMVEIARAVHHKAEVIIFDEPTATLTPEEKRHFFALMRRLQGERRLDRLHHPRARGGAAACRPHHHPARRRAGRRPTTTADFDRDKVVRAMVGRTLSTRSTTAGARPEAAQAGRQGAVGAGHLDGQRRCATIPSRSSRGRSPASSG